MALTIDCELPFANASCLVVIGSTQLAIHPKLQVRRTAKTDSPLEPGDCRSGQRDYRWLWWIVPKFTGSETGTVRRAKPDVKEGVSCKKLVANRVLWITVASKACCWWVNVYLACSWTRCKMLQRS